MGEEHRYSDEEVREILRRAVERQHERDDRLSHDELEAAAQEIGIDAGTLRRAAEEVRHDTARKRKRAERRKRERLKYLQSLLSFAFTTGLLYFVDLFTPGGPWYHWVLLIWGTIMAIKGAKLFLPGAVERRDRREDARERAHALREQKRQERQKSRAGRRQVERDFEDAVEKGVTLLLSAAAKHIVSVSRSVQTREGSEGSDFARYVTDRKRGERMGEPIPPPVVTPPPRARVAEEVSPTSTEELVEETRGESARQRRR